MADVSRRTFVALSGAAVVAPLAPLQAAASDTRDLVYFKNRLLPGLKAWAAQYPQFEFSIGVRDNWSPPALTLEAGRGDWRTGCYWRLDRLRSDPDLLRREFRPHLESLTRTLPNFENSVWFGEGSGQTAVYFPATGSDCLGA